MEKGAKINKTLSKPGGPSAKDLESIGVGTKESKEILLYDNLYGYAKYTFEMSVSNKGKVAFTFSQSGLDSVTSGNTTLTKKGELNLPVSGSALEGHPSYDVSANAKGISGISGSIGNDKSKTTYGVKYINGALAAYTSNQSNFVLPQQATNDVPTLKEKITFEQGQYLRDGGGPHLTKYDYWVEKGNLETAGEIMKREATKSLEIGVMAVATVAVGAFVVSTFGTGGLAVGGLAGGALGLGLSFNHKEKKNEE